jgi:signal transduction histidine kinase
VDSADHELKRVSHIARQSLAFYRESSKPTVFDMSQLLKTVLELYGHKIRHRDLQLDFEAGSDCRIHAFEGEIRQVFSNLVANAIDACTPGGRVRMRLRRTNAAGLPGVRIVVGDTGCGIPAENLSRIFEAFFTTKMDGTGTGLGLWVAQNILKKHHASLRVRSSVVPGRCGTVVSVFLPLGFVRDHVQVDTEAAAAV